MNIRSDVSYGMISNYSDMTMPLFCWEWNSLGVCQLRFSITRIINYSDQIFEATTFRAFSSTGRDLPSLVTLRPIHLPNYPVIDLDFDLRSVLSLYLLWCILELDLCRASLCISDKPFSGFVKFPPAACHQSVALGGERIDWNSKILNWLALFPVGPHGERE